MAVEFGNSGGGRRTSDQSPDQSPDQSLNPREIYSGQPSNQDKNLGERGTINRLYERIPGLLRKNESIHKRIPGLLRKNKSIHERIPGLLRKIGRNQNDQNIYGT